MPIDVALRGRTQLAALLQHLEQEAGQREQGQRCDQRNRRTWRQLIVGVLVARRTRLVALGRVVAPQQRVGSVKAAVMVLTYFLQRARVPVPALSTSLLEAAVHQLDPERLVTYQGKVLLVLDPTEYEKRSREQGKRGHQMEHIGRVRRSKSTSPTKQSKGHPVQPHAVDALQRAVPWEMIQPHAVDADFPQVQCVYLVECGTHAIVDATFWPYGTSERGGAATLLRAIRADMLVLWDRGLHEYDLLAAVRQRDAQALGRLPAHVKPEGAASLPDGSTLAYLRPSDRQRRPRECLLVRIIAYTLTDPALPGYGEVHRLVTTLLDPRVAPARDVVCLYHLRALDRPLCDSCPDA